MESAPMRAPISEAPTYRPEGDSYTLALLRVDDVLHVASREELTTLSKGHASFMQEMGADGDLLARGPIVPPRVEEDLRSLFLVDSQDPSLVEDRLCADPAVEAGLFGVEAMSFVTQADLQDLAGLERAVRMERGAQALRPYVLVSAPSAPEMTATLDQMDEVVILYGHCTSGSLEGSTLAILDCSTIDEARQAMGAIGPDAESFDYHAWVASLAIAELD